MIEMKTNLSKPSLFIILAILALSFLRCNLETGKEYLPKPKTDSTLAVKQGLVGAWYHGKNLTRIGASMLLKDLNPTWDVITGRGNSWSAQWEGYLTAPATGSIKFYAECDRELIVAIAGKDILHIGNENSQNMAALNLKKGQQYHINVKYLQDKGGTTSFNVLWSWENKDSVPIPEEALNFSKEQADWWNYVELPDRSEFDMSSLNTIPSENYVAYYEPGRFAGWPANNGVWCWGNEILVGFSLGYHKTDVSGGHSIRDDMPSRVVLGRSTDGGKTWSLEDPENLFGSENDKSPDINFAHPDFSMRITNSRYFVSYNRGKTWEGPYSITIDTQGEEVGELTNRTDYLVLGPQKCLVFMSAETGTVEGDYQDRAFCVLTTDGGITFKFMGWMTQDTEKRSVMPSTAQVGKNHLVSVMRRKHEESFGDRPSLVTNWIEAAESTDNGKTWVNIGKVADTDRGERNGNPPAMVRLSDERLCVAYGYREYPYGIRMKVSKDNGKTWGKECVIRADGATWDLGYCRMVINADGKLVIIYYFTTEEKYEQHIAVSIIDPQLLED